MLSGGSSIIPEYWNYIWVSRQVVENICYTLSLESFAHTTSILGSQRKQMNRMPRFTSSAIVKKNNVIFQDFMLNFSNFFGFPCHDEWFRIITHPCLIIHRYVNIYNILHIDFIDNFKGEKQYFVFQISKIR